MQQQQQQQQKQQPLQNNNLKSAQNQNQNQNQNQIQGVQSAGQTPQQQSFSPQLQAAQQQQFMGNLQQQQQQQQQQLRNANKSALQGQAPSQAPTPLPVRPTPQSQPTAQAGVASQAATPGFRASQPTPSQLRELDQLYNKGTKSTGIFYTAISIPTTITTGESTSFCNYIRKATSPTTWKRNSEES